MGFAAPSGAECFAFPPDPTEPVHQAGITLIEFRTARTSETGGVTETGFHLRSAAKLFKEWGPSLRPGISRRASISNVATHPPTAALQN